MEQRGLGHPNSYIKRNEQYISLSKFERQCAYSASDIDTNSCTTHVYVLQVLRREGYTCFMTGAVDKSIPADRRTPGTRAVQLVVAHILGHNASTLESSKDTPKKARS